MTSTILTILAPLLFATAPAPTAGDAAAPEDGAGIQDAVADSVYPVRVSEGQVTLEVRPRWSGGELVLQIAANTHSVDLSTVELMDAVRLLVDGREVEPDAATTLAGHHAVARVTFSSIATPPPAFDVRIRGVPDVAERTLSWRPGS